MEEISKRLANIRTIGLDTSIFIYHLEAHPDYSPITEQLFKGIESGQWRAITSTITIMELTVHPWRSGRGDIARKYEVILTHFPNLRVCDVTRDVARNAARVRAKYNLNPADAIHVATSLTHRAQAFITNDHKLTCASEVIEIIILDDFLDY